MRPKEQILQNPRLKIVQAWKSGLMGYLFAAAGRATRGIGCGKVG